MTVSSTTELPFTGEDVATIVLEIGMALLDVPLAVVDPPAAPLPDRAIACVHINGDWEGSVVVEVTRQLALEGTATMFDLTPDVIGPEEMADALGELANIAGGGIKALLPGSCRLTLPTVALGPDAHMILPGAELVQRLAFAAAEQHLIVTVWKRPPGAPTTVR